jgi:hypothetical protein
MGFRSQPLAEGGGVRTPRPESSLFEDAAKAGVVGLSKDPILGFVMRKMVSLFPDTDPEVFSNMERDLSDNPIVDVAQLVGQYGPLLLGGLGAVKAGVAAGGAVARGVAPRLAAGGGRLANQAQRVQRFAQGTEAGGIVGTPGLQRGLEIGGTAGAFGALGGAESAAQGKPWDQVASDAALAAALAGTVDLAFLGAGRAFSPFSRSSIDVRKAEKIARSPEFQAAQGDIEAGLRERAKKLRGDIAEAIGVDDVADDMAKAIESIGGAPIKTAPAADVLRERIFTLPVQELKNELRATKTALQGFKDFRALAADPFAYTREAALRPDTIPLWVQRVAAKVAKSPEGFRGQFGETINKFVGAAKEAERHIIAGDQINLLMVGQLRRRAMGVLVGSIPRPGRQAEFNRKMVEQVSLYQRGGVDAVNPALKEVFKDTEKLLGIASNRLARAGGEPLLTPDEFATNLITRFFPESVARKTEEAVEQSFRDGGTKRFLAANPNLGPAEANSAAHNVISKMRKTKDGIRQFGGLDAQRSVPGTLSEKLADGILLERDPFMSLLSYINGVNRRMEYGSRFGMRNELRTTIQELAAREGGNRGLINTTVDSFLAHKYEPVFNREWARRLTNLQMTSKLAMAVIPNLSQSINTALFFGIKDAAVAAFKAPGMTGAERKQVRTALALQDEIFQMMRRSYMGESSRGISDRFADSVLTWTGFSTVERFNRLYAGVTGFHTVRDTVAKHLTGRLRGQTLTVAKRRMSRLGINLDEVKKRGHLIPEEEHRAIFNAAQQTQFVPDAARRPSLWTTPHGRIIFQFKNFALSQGRFLRDSLFKEAAQGNYKPLATFLSIYPVAGELVGSTLAELKQKPRTNTGITRVAENLSMVGAAGVFQQIYISAQFGRLAETFLGPTLSDATEMVGSMLRQDPNQITRFLERQPLTRALELSLGLGIFGIQAAEEYLSEIGTGIDDETLTLQELGQRQRPGGFRTR